jgi:acylphosphatase
MRNYCIHVHGKVQGVFFRATAARMATLLSIKGFVKNEIDGNVFIEAEGEEEMLTKFIQWCHQGPDNAEVKYVSVTNGDIKNYKTFTIIR